MTYEINTTTCPWCGSDQVHLLAIGTIAPWIIVSRTTDHETQLCDCTNCGLYFFRREFSAAELDRIYADYRSFAYFKRRNRWEPWYSKAVNDAIGHNEETVKHRRLRLQMRVQEYVSHKAIDMPTRILDFGGDEGQFIPDLSPSCQKRVYEVSSSPTVDGVQRVSSWHDVEDFAPNFVMICHVLEHTRDAREIVQRAYEALPEGGLLYVEVPLDRPPKPSRLLATTFQSKYSRLVVKSRLTWIPLDLFSLLARRYLKMFPPGSVVKQSEHIQYFDENSIRVVLEQIGFRHLEFDTYLASVDVPRLATNALGVLAVK